MLELGHWEMIEPVKCERAGSEWILLATAAGVFRVPVARMYFNVQYRYALNKDIRDLPKLFASRNCS